MGTLLGAVALLGVGALLEAGGALLLEAAKFCGGQDNP